MIESDNPFTTRFFAAIFIALAAEGLNALGIYRASSPLYVGPLAAMLVVIIGCLMWVKSPTD